MRLPWLAVAVLLSAFASASCKKETTATADPPKDAATQEGFKASDLDFNPLLGLPEHGAVPAGSASAGAAEAAESGAAPEGGGAPLDVALKSPGADPKTPLRYAFAVGQHEGITATFKTSMREDAAGAPAQPPGQQPPVRLALDVVATETKGDQTRFALRITNAELVTKGMNVPPQVEQQLAAVTGALLKVTGTFRVGTTGTIKDIEFAAGARGAASGMTGELLPLLQQAIEMLFIVLPQEPIGVGAAWTTKTAAAEGGGAGLMVSTYTLKDRTKTGAVVHVDVDRSVPAQAVPDPRAPPGSTMEMKGKGAYDVQVRLTGPAQRSVGDAETRVLLKDPGSKRTMTTVVKVSQVLESKPGAP